MRSFQLQNYSLKNTINPIKQIISLVIIFNIIFTGMGFCSFASDHQHGKDNAPCLHFHQSEKEANYFNPFHDNCQNKKQDTNHNSNKLHCHANQIIVCLNDFTVFISTFNHEPFFENPLTFLVSHISTRIDHIPIHTS
ncbi:MAG: hypothetical protein K8R68_00865 [Bacteroidales bacterium]|nr:hypothetical protein [Bacteroidales bacterium]